jgi:hypothetical protein
MQHDLKITTFVADSSYGEVLPGTSRRCISAPAAMGYFGCGVTIILVLNRVCVEQSHVVSLIRKEIVVSLKSMNAASSDFHGCGGR